MTAVPIVLKLHADDNVGVALKEILSGDALAAFELHSRETIPRGHKIALTDIPPGQPVRKFGQPIGLAGTAIDAGAHVHTHNLKLSGGTRCPGPETANLPWPITEPAEFEGYRRADGQAGTRNYVAVMATVNCSATVVRRIVERISADELARHVSVDGVVPVTHTSGCGMSAQGEGMEILQRTLRGFITHPNVGAVLLVGLGCEANQLGALLAVPPALEPGPRLRTMTIQGAGGTLRAIDRGEKELRELLAIANRFRRTRLPASSLTLGLQCGGSDGYSGISANPALGAASDRLVRAGGSVVLAETPEIFGAEQLLYRRAESPAVARQLSERLAWWEDYAAREGASLNNNPSPGNLAGGISTIFEKSLGAVAKSGTSPLRAVVRYAERVPKAGFVFMDSPGYDPCSVTGEIAAGANLICFTTGRGSVFGSKPAPSIKLATHSQLARRMNEDIDFDCGGILAGDLTIDEAGLQIFSLILEVASGRQSASEALGMGDLEFVPWQVGAVL